jgi:hypothetical protein
MDWLKGRLKDKPAMVTNLRDEAPKHDIAVGTLYAAKSRLKIVESKAQIGGVGRHYLVWSLPAMEA